MKKVIFWSVLSSALLVCFAIYKFSEIPREGADSNLATFAERVRSDLRGKGYFIPGEIGFPSAVFFCVCGPYNSCRPQAGDMAKALGYEMPGHDFVTGLSRPRQLFIYFILAKSFPSRFHMSHLISLWNMTDTADQT